MVCAGRLAEARGLVAAGFTLRLQRLLVRLRLPTKPESWPVEDLLAVMERAGLPISEKQRNYFL